MQSGNGVGNYHQALDPALRLLGPMRHGTRHSVDAREESPKQ